MFQPRSRRDVIGTLASSIALYSAGFFRQGVAARVTQLQSGGVGLSREEFEAIYGPGEPELELVRYPRVERDAVVMYVGHDNDLVAHIEIGYDAFESGGVAPEHLGDQIASWLPTDAAFADSMIVPARHRELTTFHLSRYESATLGKRTGGRSGILVVAQARETILDAGAPLQTVIERLTLTVPSGDLPSLDATGEPGGIGLSRQDWEAVYGSGQATQVGTFYTNVTLPETGSDVLVRFTPDDQQIAFLEFSYDELGRAGGVSPSEAEGQSSGAIPIDSQLLEQFDLPATPEGPIALRIHHWESETVAALGGPNGSVMTMFQVIPTQQDFETASKSVVARMALTTLRIGQ